MTDLVERLRAMAKDLLHPHDRLALEAADEIERLDGVLEDLISDVEEALNKASIPKPKKEPR